MKLMEIIAKLDDLGEISEDRRQNIKLSEVAMSGDYLQGDKVKIYICDEEMAKEIDNLILRKNRE